MFSNRYAYLLGAAAYDDPGIPTLSTPVNDINRIASILKDNYNFVVKTIANPTASEFRQVLTQDLPGLPVDAQVILYYAGHGLSEESGTGIGQGHLVPVDAKMTGQSIPEGAISMEEVAGYLVGLPNAQLVLILDCCYAGLFEQAALNAYANLELTDNSVARAEIVQAMPEPFMLTGAPAVAERAIPGSKAPQHAEAVYRTRQVLTSTAFDQKARDSFGNEPTETGNSPFAAMLCDGLTVDLQTTDNNDGKITLPELKTYMEGRLEQFKQRVALFPFAGDKNGEFIFYTSNYQEITDTKRRNPFMGLMDYEPADAPYYFGRQAVIAELMERLRNEPFMVVVGASGTGKSSLVKAGILPRVDPQAYIITPGTNPMAALNALSPNPNRFLVIDQLEEVITQAYALEKKGLLTAFVQSLIALLDNKQVKGIICTLRIEFINTLKCEFDKERTGLWNQYSVPVFSVQDLNDIILGPARKVGVFFKPEETVVSKITNDFRLYPNALPLLSFALSDLFSTPPVNNTILEEDYKGIGVVLRTKEQILKDIRTDDLHLEAEVISEFRQDLMIRFISFQRGTPVRRQVPFSDASKYELQFEGRFGELADRLLKALEANRLIEKAQPVRTNDVPLPGEEGYVELAHETLISSWEEFRSWQALLGADTITRRTELAKAARNYAYYTTCATRKTPPQKDVDTPPHDRPALWTEAQLLGLISKKRRSVNEMTSWLFFKHVLLLLNQTERPQWSYFWFLEKFDDVFGHLHWLSAPERTFLKKSYKAAVWRRIKVTILLLVAGLLFQGALVGYTFMQAITASRDKVNEKLLTANLLDINHDYDNSLLTYGQIDTLLRGDPFLQENVFDLFPDSIRIARYTLYNVYCQHQFMAAKRNFLMERKGITALRHRYYRAITNTLRRADSSCRTPHDKSSVDENITLLDSLFDASKAYNKAIELVEQAKRATLPDLPRKSDTYSAESFRNTCNDLMNHAQLGIDLTALQLEKLQRNIKNQRYGSRPTGRHRRIRTAQRKRYQQVDQQIRQYLSKMPFRY